jgi:hypothetical protein
MARNNDESQEALKKTKSEPSWLACPEEKRRFFMLGYPVVRRCKQLFSFGNGLPRR